MKAVSFHPEARAELLDAFNKESPERAARLDHVVTDALDLISRDPSMWSTIKGVPVHKCVLRHHLPYLIIYQNLPDTIWIVAVAHSSRRPDYWKKRAN